MKQIQIGWNVHVFRQTQFATINRTWYPPLLMSSYYSDRWSKSKLYRIPTECYRGIHRKTLLPPWQFPRADQRMHEVLTHNFQRKRPQSVSKQNIDFEEKKPTWLVVELPLWKIWKSGGITIPNMWKSKKIQTTNQQPLYPLKRPHGPSHIWFGRMYCFSRD